jgi:hypothetical protein
MSDLAGSIRRSLWAIRDHYDEALDAPRAGGISGVRGSKEPPLPVSAHVLDARRACHHDLLHYARAIQFMCTDIEGRSIQTRLDGDDPAELAAFIDRWAENLERVAQAEARLCEAEMAAHARTLFAVATGVRVRRFPVGPCPEHGTSDMGERIPCPGELSAALRSDDSLLPSEVVCSEDREHRWSASQWLMLGRRVTELSA